MRCSYMNDWKIQKIGDICNVTDYVANGSFASLNQNVDYLNNQDYAVMVRLADHNARWKSSLLYTTKKSYEFLKKSRLEVGDVVIANVGANAGTVFRAPDLGMPMTLAPNAVACFPRDLNVFDRDFLYYYFSSPMGQWNISTILGGSAQPKFNKTDFRSLELCIPSIDNQRAIAYILRTLDEKIELNRKTNETLEAIAKGFFKSWFIDFDPVRAKVESRSTKLPNEISELFPNSFEDSQFDEIPSGWKFCDLCEIANFQNGYAFKSKEYIEKNETSIEVLRMGYIDRGGGFKEDNSPVFVATSSKGYQEKYQIEKNDLIIAMTDMKEKMVILGCCALIEENKRFVLNQRVGRIRVLDSGLVDPRYLYIYMNHPTHIDLIRTKSNSGVQVNLSTDVIKNTSILIPDESIMKVFKTLSEKLFSQIFSNNKEIKTLVQIRNTMLPKLITGELKVSEVEKIDI